MNILLTNDDGWGFEGLLALEEVAQQFGGGGHKAAAGAFVEGTLDEVQGRVLPVVRQAMRVALGQC